MQFHYGGLETLSLDASAVTIGSFDGVHLGHQVLMSQLIETARQKSLPSVVVTFFPHPIVVLRGLQHPFYLTLPEEKAGILRRLGIDYVVTIPFTKSLSEKTPFEFMSMLHDHLNVRELVIGPDFALGKDRLGNPDTLREIGKTMGYNVEIVPFRQDQDGRISSSRIRTSLTTGQIETANALLGRPYTIPVTLLDAGTSEADDGGTTRVELSCDPMQLLPAAGLYNAFVEQDTANPFTLFIRSVVDQGKPLLTGWLSAPITRSLGVSQPSCLSIVSASDTLPPTLSGIAANDPILTEINRDLKGD